MTSSSFAVFSSLTGLVAFVCEIAILVVVATVVRRHRPDAYGKLLAWAILSPCLYAVFFVLGFVVPRVVSYSSEAGIDGFYKAQMMLMALRSLGGVVSVLLLIRGLVALAQPPKPIDPGQVGPYR